MNKLTDKEFINSLTDEEKQLIKDGKFDEFLKTTKNKTLLEDLFSVPMLKSSLQGPTLGFADEIYGGVFAGLSGDLDNYEKFRDKYRAETKRFEERRPVLSAAGQIATSLPFLALKPLQGAQSARAALAANPIKTTIGTGLLGGAGAGAGFSERDFDLSDPAFLSDVGLGATVGAGGNVLLQKAQDFALPYVKKLGAFMTPEKSAKKLFVTENLRDQDTFSGLLERMNRPDMIAGQVVGPNTFSLLDTVVTAPGKTKTKLKTFLEEGRETRAKRMKDILDTNLLAKITDKEQPSEFIQRYTKDKFSAAQPIYKEMESFEINLNNNLKDILKRAETTGAFSKAQKLAKAEPRSYTFGITGKTKDIQDINFKTIQTIKEGLDSKIQTMKPSKLRNSYMNIKNELIDEINSQTVLDIDKKIGGIDYKKGDSLYEKARGLWSGASSFGDALAEGRKAFAKRSNPKTLLEVRDRIAKYTDSEKDAFKLGAFDSISTNLKFKSGPRELLRLQDPKTGGEIGVREQFEILFGKDSKKELEEFINFMNAEAGMLRMERLGAGSPSAERITKLTDSPMDALRFGNNLRNIISGDLISPVIDQAANRRGSFELLPENVRNRFGDLMFMNREELAKQNLDKITPDALDDELRGIVNNLARTNVLQFGLLQPQTQGLFD